MNRVDLAKWFYEAHEEAHSSISDNDNVDKETIFHATQTSELSEFGEKGNELEIGNPSTL